VVGSAVLRSILEPRADEQPEHDDDSAQWSTPVSEVKPQPRYERPVAQPRSAGTCVDNPQNVREKSPRITTSAQPES
jgi:hypothetical protein